jgi:HEAT repeat protein
VVAVASLRAPETLSYLLRSLRDVDWTVRRTASVALVHFPYPGTVLGLRRALRDPHPDVLREAISGLGKLRAPVSFALVPFLQHQLPAVRLAAVKALRDIGDPASRLHIVTLLNDPSPDVVEVVLNLLEQPVERKLEGV